VTEPSAPRNNVLEELDQQVPTSFYWSLTILATIGGFLFGYDTANIGAALDFVPFELGDFALGYLVAGTSLGAAAGAILAGPLTDRYGRKSLLIVDALIYALGALLSAVAPDESVLIIARTLIGLAIGADSAIATAYIAEYAPRNRRGALGMLQQWMITIGILVAYLVSLVLLTMFPESADTLVWRLIFGIGAVPAVVGLVLRARMPESPRWLLRHGRYEDTRKALGKLGVDASLTDIEETGRWLRSVEAHQKETRTTNWTAGVRRALAVVCVFFVFQQITGINVPLYYGPHMLGPLFQEGQSQVDATTAAIEVTTLMTVVNVAATFLAFRYIDRVGRRKLALGGFTGMAVAALVTSVGLTMFSDTPRIVMVMIGLNVFIAAFAIGVGGTGWLIQGEVFPTAVRGQAAALGATADWLANYAVIQVFPSAESAFGLGAVMVGFAFLCVLAVGFVHRFLPETKGRSVEEITQVFEREADRSPLSRSTTDAS
jgi:MFS transporter, SP family, arabinose:H+ symporter